MRASSRSHLERSDKLRAQQCQEKSDSKLNFFRRSGLGGKDHVVRLLAAAAAIFDVKLEVILEDVVLRRKPERDGRAIDCFGRALEFNKRPDGRFIQLNQQPACPPGGSGHRVGRAVFLVAEPSLEAQSVENFCQRCSVGYFHFDLLANFVPADMLQSALRARSSLCPRGGCPCRREFGLPHGRRLECKNNSLLLKLRLRFRSPPR